MTRPDHHEPSPLQLLKGKRILIVEDEYFVADETRRALQAVGAKVIGPAPSVEIGMSMIDQETIDAAVLDIRLEGETVFPIAERLHALAIPFVFATAYITTDIPEKFGGYHLCEKPTALAEIATALFTPKPLGH
ncbi:response regulator [Rhizobium mesoamericanum]|uniref:Response regulator receiver protein n=1 Tax=Rhizobium mesoamericanum STM3625 TaxID=1211777 RepID=K0Q1N6_9HYPH|nr:response regulator [Rhizobium mesoamericanum]CCM78155.1 Response regulator receiver protein [Rhizobium mesoamericanum STM3625]